MLSLCRGLLAGLLVAGLAALCLNPTTVGAQDKKDPKAKTAKEEVADRSASFTTSDGLSLKGYWFPGVGAAAVRPDAVIMVPSPGNKITEPWIWLAKALSEKNFSVLLFDWRGTGLNGPGPDGSGVNIFDDKTRFWAEGYNNALLKSSMSLIDKKGLDYTKQLSSAGTTRARYRDFMFMNDLQAARFYIDQQNDDQKTNSNRIWIVSEKEGSHLAMAFIAAEFQRGANYEVRNNFFDFNQEFTPAGKDYVGMMSFSYSTGGTAGQAASKIFANALPSMGENKAVVQAKEHLRDHMGLVLMYGKNDGAASRGLLNSLGVTTVVEADLKEKNKYPKEFDLKAKKPISGIDMIDPTDSAKVREYVVFAMEAIRKKQGQRAPTTREAKNSKTTPRFPAEKFLR